MKSIKTLVLAAMALSLSSALASPALADSPATKQWVLATAKATGKGGEQFVSSLRIVNPGTVDANVSLTYLAQSPLDGSFAATGDNTSADTQTFKVGAGKMLPIEDVLGTQFGGAAPFGIVAGGIKVLSDLPVSVLSRTFVANGLSSTGKPGTYGFSIPAQVDAQAISLGDTGYIPYIAASPNATSGFRCNFIMLSTVAATTTLNVALKKADGSVVGSRDYTLGPLSSAQQADIAASFGYTGPDENLFVVVTVKSGGPVVVGTSIIDNAISSLNYAPPTKTGSGGGGTFPDGIYGMAFKASQDLYGMAANVTLVGGSMAYMLFNAVTECGTTPQLHTKQVFPLNLYPAPNGNTTVTKNPDGSIAFSGASTGGDPGSWNGVIRPTATGIGGTLTYQVAASSSTCPGASITYDFVGAYVASPIY